MNYLYLLRYVANGYLEGAGAMNPGPFVDGNIFAPFESSTPKSQFEEPACQSWRKKKQSNSGAACTQAVVWDELSGTGQLMHARNMDGETDDTKVTVSHLIVFAVQPAPNSREIR